MKFDEAQVKLERIQASLNKRYAGKRAVITSCYNGQPHGSSRPAMTGKSVVIRYVTFDAGIWVFVEDENLALRPDELELVPPEGGAR